MCTTIAAAHLVEDVRLPLAVGCRGIGLGDVKRDLAVGERLEDDRGQTGEAKTALDETDRHAEAARDPLDVGALLDEVLKGEALVGRVKRELLEILGEACLGDSAAEVIEHEAGDLDIGGERAGLRQRLERRVPPTAGFHREGAPRLLVGGDDQVLQQAARLYIGAKLEVSHLVAASPDVALRGNELVERDGLDHGTGSVSPGARLHLRLTCPAPAFPLLLPSGD